MSEIGPTTTVAKTTPALAPGTFLPADSKTKASFGIIPEISLASLDILISKSVGGGIASVPHTAEKTYRFVLDNGTIIPVLSAFISQRINSLMSMEMLVIGKMSSFAWATSAVGRIIDMYTIAKDRSGQTIADNLLVTVEITNIINEGDKLRLQCLSVFPPRSNNTIEISDILFLQTSSTGKRSLRCPVPWGVQAGDTLTHSSIADFVVERLAITLSRKYSIVDVTEAI